MDWKRGFFRLWLVFTALWAAGCLALGWQHAFDRHFVIFTEGEFQSLSDWHTDPGDTSTVVLDVDGHGEITVAAGAREEVYQAVVRRFLDERWGRRWARAKPYALMAFLIPTILLILGKVLVWIGRGFRSDPKPTGA